MENFSFDTISVSLNSMRSCYEKKKNNVTSMREMLLRAFSTQFNGMKNEVYYYHMLTFSHNKFFLPSFNVSLNSSWGKS